MRIKAFVSAFAFCIERGRKEKDVRRVGKKWVISRFFAPAKL